MNNNFENLIVVGASRGVGAAVSEHLVSRTNRLISVSRSASSFGEWVKADISTKQGIGIVRNSVGDSVLDGLLYMGGTWENKAFTKDFEMYWFLIRLNLTPFPSPC